MHHTSVGHTLVGQPRHLQLGQYDHHSFHNHPSVLVGRMCMVVVVHTAVEEETEDHKVRAGVMDTALVEEDMVDVVDEVDVVDVVDAIDVDDMTNQPRISLQQ